MHAGEATSNVERIAAAAGEAEAGARTVNDLALDLLRLNIGLDHGNVALSPWSIAIALAMTRVGARGDTAAEMERVLHVVDAATYDQAMNALDQALRDRNRMAPMGNLDWLDEALRGHSAAKLMSDVEPPDVEPLAVELSAANRLFAQAGLNLLPPFLDTLAARYGAAVGEVDYVKATEAARLAINEWVAAETRERIPELIRKGVLGTDTRLVLANAVYLRARWETPFAKHATTDGTFHAPAGDVTVPFMQATERRGWSEGDGWKAVELAYVGGELAMTFVVPDAGQFDRVVSGLDQALLERVVATRPAKVRLRLPRFDIAKSVLLGPQLRALGMPLAFSPKADFSGITADARLRIAEVVHQANITVDEKGTVATASTTVITQLTSASRATPKQLDVDRPFVLLLRDRPTGALLFVGQVTNPA